MPDVQPFAALRYDPSRVALGNVVSPPYDVISPEEHQSLLARSPHNIVRIELPITDGQSDSYSASSSEFRSWIRDGIVKRDVARGMYCYDQEFTNGSGVLVTRHGFLCVCRLEEFARGNILPHEKTLSGPKEDRLKLLHAVQANVSPIFGMYIDPEHHVRQILEHAAGVIEADIVDEAGERHVLRRVTDGEALGSVRDAMQRRRIYIADGHHRYETALAYRNEMVRADPNVSSDAPWKFILMYLAAMEDEGMEIQATHRVLHSLSSFDRAQFEHALATLFQTAACATMEEGLNLLHEVRSEGFLFAYPSTSECTIARLRATVDRTMVLGGDVPHVLHDVSVTLLHRIVFRDIFGISDDAQLRKENIDYVHTIDGVRAALGNGSTQCAVMLNPTTMTQLRAAAEAGVVLPQKSTYFYPKLITGLVMHDITTSR